MTEINLIEQLGGYEAAKAHIRELVSDYDEGVTGKTKLYDFQFSVGQVEQALLEHRRQHNIFEVGDKVIKTHPKNTILWPVLGVYKNGGVWLDYKGFCWKPPRVRHATDEEIKAGKRLEVMK